MIQQKLFQYFKLHTIHEWHILDKNTYRTNVPRYRYLLRLNRNARRVATQYVYSQMRSDYLKTHNAYQ